MTTATKPILVTVTIDGTKVDIKHKRHNFVSGVYGDYLFEAKIYNIGSKFGINNGRVSKLSIRLIQEPKTEWIANYDRGWDVRPKAEYRDVYKKILRALDAVPPWPETDM